MGRKPRSKEMLKEIRFKCNYCGDTSYRAKWKLLKNKKRNERPTCSAKCAGKLGGLTNAKSRSLALKSK